MGLSLHLAMSTEPFGFGSEHHQAVNSGSNLPPTPARCCDCVSPPTVSSFTSCIETNEECDGSIWKGFFKSSNPMACNIEGEDHCLGNIGGIVNDVYPCVDHDRSTRAYKVETHRLLSTISDETDIVFFRDLVRSTLPYVFR